MTDTPINNTDACEFISDYLRKNIVRDKTELALKSWDKIMAQTDDRRRIAGTYQNGDYGDCP